MRKITYITVFSLFAFKMILSIRVHSMYHDRNSVLYWPVLLRTTIFLYAAVSPLVLPLHLVAGGDPHVYPCSVLALHGGATPLLRPQLHHGGARPHL